MRAYIGLGANLGDAPATLTAAVHALAALPGAGLRGVSSLYGSRPVGVLDQPDFHNAVVALDVPRGPEPRTGALALLTALKSLELAFGRQPRRRWGERELDLDLLVFGRRRIVVEDGPLPLVVPHPRSAERLFVLAPLAELVPGLVPPGWTMTVGRAARQARTAEAPDAVRRIAAWDAATRTWRPRPPA
ncbi:MAG TPA: 2-amino-4-hydroxy-6-hydroxymethyldihydropteridine diphosphokinase [Candidatus Limnocylindrales bacterium]|nr:2-amino-4-hydroxy-6-hydroxymethyldihydropteridine diphosphokinase [Candidatus Limnocylindrales bacterium]